MDLNPAHVRTLREIARHGSFSRAAESLRLSQPAVSLHIRQLEARCGTALLERVGKQGKWFQVRREGWVPRSAVAPSWPWWSSSSLSSQWSMTPRVRPT